MTQSRPVKLDPRFHTLPPYNPDPRAIRLAQALLERVTADNIVVFGSRARGDWHQHSDVDLLIVQAPAHEREHIQDTARVLAIAIFGQPKPDIDFVYRTHRECRIQIQHSVNGIAAVAYREGVAMEPYPQPGDEPEPESDLTEIGEMSRRLVDANQNYLSMHALQDYGFSNDVVAALAHQTLEHALKALISAQAKPYPRTHDLVALCQSAGLEPNKLQSYLSQLDQYAGGAAYDDPTQPVEDFAVMTNAVTDDLKCIYDRIEALTGLNAWSVQPTGTPSPIRPVYR